VAVTQKAGEATFWVLVGAPYDFQLHEVLEPGFEASHGQPWLLPNWGGRLQNRITSVVTLVMHNLSPLPVNDSDLHLWDPAIRSEEFNIIFGLVS
jgi:hypothetical protein